MQRNVHRTQRYRLVSTRVGRCSAQRFERQDRQSKTTNTEKSERRSIDQVWNLRETPYTNLATLRGHQEAVLSLTVKERTVFSGSADKSIFVRFSLFFAHPSLSPCRFGISMIMNRLRRLWRIRVRPSPIPFVDRHRIDFRSRLLLDAFRSSFVQFIE